MAEWLFTFFDAPYYLSSNIHCLVSMVELITSKLLLLIVYTDLLVDVAELFSIMLVLSVIIASSVNLLTHVHESASKTTHNRSSISRSYIMYCKYLQFKNKI